MSFDVVNKVLEHSEERHSRRLILFVLAELAHDDGVAYLGQDKIAHRCRLTRTYVAEALQAMAHDRALEIRKAHRPGSRSRFSIYRLSSLPGLKPVDYERLPFTLDRPFSPDPTVSELPTSSNGDGVGSDGSTVSELSVDSVGSDGSSPLTALDPDRTQTRTHLAARASASPPAQQELVPTTATTSQTLVGEFVDGWRDSIGNNPPRRFVGQLARAIFDLLDEGQPPAAVHAGLRRMVERKVMQPSLLHTFVAEAAVVHATPNKKFGRRAVTGAEMGAYAERLRAAEDADASI